MRRAAELKARLLNDVAIRTLRTMVPMAGMMHLWFAFRPSHVFKKCQ